MISKTWRQEKSTKDKLSRRTRTRFVPFMSGSVFLCHLLTFSFHSISLYAVNTLHVLTFVPVVAPVHQDSEDEDDDEAETSVVKVDDSEAQKNKRLEKKRRLKERFDTEYDDGDATYFDDLKEELQKQAEVRRPHAPRIHRP